MTDSPTARALLALELIQARPGITSAELAEALGVSDRAARRYVAILREAGLTIEATSGRYGGYRIGRGLRLPPLTFTAMEALALVMAVLDGHHDLTDPDDPSGAALSKIMRGLPPAVAAQAETVSRAAAAAPDRSAVRPDPATTAALVDACAQRRRVRVEYRSEAGSDRTMEVEPWTVVVRHGRWYLLCRSRTEDALRTYRVDRVRRVELLRSTFRAPPDLDPVRALEEHLATGWEYEADVLIDAPVDLVRRRLTAALGRIEPADRDTTRLRGTTSNPAWYAEQLASVPWPFRILESAELRLAASTIGQRLLDSAGPAPAH